MDEQINGLIETIKELEKENSELKWRLEAVRGQLPDKIIIYIQARKLGYQEFCKWINDNLVNLR